MISCAINYFNLFKLGFVLFGNCFNFLKRFCAANLFFCTVVNISGSAAYANVECAKKLA